MGPRRSSARAHPKEVEVSASRLGPPGEFNDITSMDSVTIPVARTPMSPQPERDETTTRAPGAVLHVFTRGRIQVACAVAPKLPPTHAEATWTTL